MDFFRRLLARLEPRLEQIVEVSDAAAGDGLVIQQLRQLGADLSQPRHVRHYLYFPSCEAATTAAWQLKPEGFAVDVRRSGDTKMWLALAAHTIVVSGETIGPLRDRLSDIATSLGGEYDGWEAAPDS